MLCNGGADGGPRSPAAPDTGGGSGSPERGPIGGSGGAAGAGTSA
jgi:hypothetical protein